MFPQDQQPQGLQHNILKIVQQNILNLVQEVIIHQNIINQEQIVVVNIIKVQQERDQFLHNHVLKKVQEYVHQQVHREVQLRIKDQLNQEVQRVIVDPLQVIEAVTEHRQVLRQDRVQVTVEVLHQAEATQVAPQVEVLVDQDQVVVVQGAVKENN
jgi:hypothetical protein